MTSPTAPKTPDGDLLDQAVAFAEMWGTEENWQYVRDGYVNAILRDRDANAALAPALVDAVKAMIGLCQLLRNRDDCPTEIRQALTHNHRIIEAYQALSSAGIEGFQPADFDHAKAEGRAP